MIPAAGLTSKFKLQSNSKCKTQYKYYRRTTHRYKVSKHLNRKWEKILDRRRRRSFRISLKQQLNNHVVVESDLPLRDGISRI